MAFYRDRQRTMRRKQALGFTLIELAVVILLISIFMGLGLSALDVQQTNRAYSETREKQEKIKDALVTHLANFRRLPCPDTKPTGGAPTPPDGVENRVGGNPANPCSNPGGAPINPAFGVVPYATLGLSRDDALDGWDNFFSYEVSRGGPNEWALSTTFGPPAGFFTGNGGGIRLNGRNAGGVFALNLPGALGIAAIIVSHGRNGSGAFTTKGAQNQAPLPALADEVDNTNDVNSVFFQREFTDVAPPGGGGTFDDLVLALTPSDLLTPAIKDGALQSAMAQVREQLRTVRDTAFGQVPGATPPCTPPANLAALVLPDTVTVDPWGTTINYIQANSGPVGAASPAVGTVAFCAWSSGPDRTTPAVCGPAFALTGDDVGLPPVTYDQLRTAFSTGTQPPPCP